MSKLVELNPADHGNYRVAEHSAAEAAQKQHIINLRVTEVGQAVTSFPVFFTKVANSTNWAMSALCSLEPEHNLFVRDGRWDAIYQPTVMQTYPFYLMQKPDAERQYTVGIDVQNKVFESKDGEALFDDKGKATLYLSKVTALLEADLKNDLHTFDFARKLEELGLMKSVDVLVFYEGDKVNTLKGLHTLDEEKLQALETEPFETLRKQGYLAPIYAMLISLAQLNALIRRHNQSEEAEKIAQVKLEVSRPPSAS